MPEYLTRPPRIQPELPAQDVTIPAPPSVQGDRQSLLQLALPIITIIGYVLISGGRGGSSILFVLPMGLSMVGSTLLALISFRRNRKNEAEAQAEYAQRLM